MDRVFASGVDDNCSNSDFVIVMFLFCSSVIGSVLAESTVVLTVEAKTIVKRLIKIKKQREMIK